MNTHNEIDFDKRLAELKAGNTEFMIFCPHCGYIERKSTAIKRIKENIVVRNEDFLIEGEARFCTLCETHISDITLDDLRLKTAYSEYRKNHKLLLPDEITAIYKKYGLSAKSFARILGFGDNTIYRYEKGALQEKSHDALIKLVSIPSNLNYHLMHNEIEMSATEKRKLNARLSEMMSADLDEYKVFPMADKPYIVSALGRSCSPQETSEWMSSLSAA